MHEKVQCVQCHVKPVFTNVGKNCADCHKSSDVHRGQMGSDCAQCHTVQGWSIATKQVKEHQNRFPLLGAHAAVQCDDCHKQAAVGIFYGLSTDCQSCHLKDWQNTTNPPHAQDPADFPPSGCQTCHKTFDSWLGASFNGNHAAPPINFPLTLGHANVPCQQCHISNNYHLQIAATDCGNAGCHLTTWQQTNNPPHPSAGPTFGVANCANCHNPSSWTNVVFDHSTTGFPLTNGHANLQCAQCHVNNNYNLQTAPTDCGNAGCHLTTWQTTNNPVHSTAGPAFAATNCSQCHDTIAWTDMNSFNHTVTGFTLTGAHVTTPCTQCHVNNNYTLQIQQNDCGNSGCHLTQWNSTQTLGGGVPNHISAGFPISQCSTCHNTTSWGSATFDHSTTGFPLTNSHQMAPAGKVTACAQCHINNNYNLQIQPTDCGNAGCHLNTWQTTNNPVHSTAGPTFAVANCSGCHDTIAWTDQTGFNHSVTGFALVGTHATTPCAQCHVNNNYNLTSADCMGCHQSSWTSTQTLGGNVPNHVTASFPTTAAACATCHPITTWADGKFDHSSTGFPLTNSHQMAPAGKVTACTQCHVGGNFSLSIQPTDCGNSGCHLTTWQQTNNPTHSTAGTAFAAANCSTCHDTITWTDNTFNHSVTGWPLTGAHTTTPCANCHTNNNYNFTQANTDCYGCHQDKYNSTATMGGTVPNHVAAAFPTSQCSSCHTTTNWTSTWNHTSTGFTLTGTHSTTPCAQCHTNNNYSLNSSNTDCMSCHQPAWTSTQTLGGNVPNHVAANFPQTAAACSTCHPITTWADGKFDHSSTGFPLANSHQMAPAGKVTACTQCHVGGNYTLSIQPTDCGNSGCHLTTWQQTNNPTHSSAGSAFAASNCSTCHDTITWTDNTFNHAVTGWPLTGSHQLAPAGKVANCTQCHTGNNYNLNSTACYPCHTTDWTSTQTLGGNVPNHITAGFPQTCDTCHDMIAWSDSTFNHNNTGFPLTGLHTSVQCAQCHTTAAGGYNLPAPTGCGQANCHQTDYNGTNNPVHSAAGTTFAAANCTNCHSVNAAFTTTSWSHTSTGWALVGNHQMSPAGVVTNCNQCHTGNNYNITSTACYPCHTTDWNSTQTLGGNVPNHITAGFPQTCDTCHDTINWADSTFNHNNTGFPLTGLHTSVQCAQCHTTAAGGYNLPAPTGCGQANCHQTDYNGTNNPVHSAAGTTFAAANCTNCHSVNAAFTTTSWSHSSTNWPLTGNHQMSPAGIITNCNQCHTGNNYGLTTGDCWSSNCHTTDWNSTATLGGAVPNHVAANFPTSMCSSCHDTVNWADGKFDHSTTGWALTGGHIVPTSGGVQACTDCHVSNNYSLTSANTVCYGCHLAEWNSTQTLGGSVPNHIAAGYPTTCDTCHTTTNWLGATFNHTYFPIPHHGSVCADCHQVSTDYSQFTCINCHTDNYHTQSRTDNQHGGVKGYTYGPTTCYNCHKNGGGN